MGLDQYAWTKADFDFNNSIEHLPFDEWVEQRKPEAFYWRKHAQLQTFMDNAYAAQNKDVEISWDTFNCIPLELSRELVVELQGLVTDSKLPHCDGGFFWGHQFQDESTSRYREQDLKFCEWALEKIDSGKPVVYYCSW